MSGQIKIAFRTPDDPIEDVALNARELEGEDARVARELAITAALDGCRTAGDLLHRVERAVPAERRRMLDEAREAVGLRSVEDAEARAKFEAANDIGVLRSRQRQQAELVIGPGGAITEVNADEIERERRADELRAETRRQRREERDAEAEAIRRARARYDEAMAGHSYYDPPVANIPHWRLGPR